ncbi:hypothetical protein F4804DRAFT_299716, partial [Jackrogersella minutella]
MANLLSAAVLITAVQALAFDGKPAQPTNGLIPNPTFQYPEITLPPSIHELAKRQSGQTVLIGPDNTCGYFEGRAGAVYSCNGEDVTCALVTTSTYGAVACCDGSDCGLRVACVDYLDYYSSSACDDGCAQDTFTVKCTHKSAPYCGTVTFFSGISDYYCDTLSASTPQQLYTTYSGETDGRSFTPVAVSIDEDSSTGTHAASSTEASSDDETATSDSSAGATSLTNSGSSSSSSSSGSNSSSKKSSTNVGAIAGGVVGGVAGLALIGLGIFFLIRHNSKKSKDAAAAAAGAPQMQQGPGTNGGPGQPPVAGFQQQPYNPHFSQQYPQQGHYPDPNNPGGFVSAAALELDRNSSTSPVSQLADSSNRPGSFQPTSPSSTINSNWQQNPQGGVAGYPPQQHSPQPNVPPTVFEAGGNVVGERDYNANHHGQFHEL